MTRKYDYRIPKERIDDSFRIRLEGEYRPVNTVPRESCDMGRAKISYNGCPAPLAIVYSPYQPFENLYDEETALCRGTLFKDIDLPFYGRACTKENVK